MTEPLPPFRYVGPPELTARAASAPAMGYGIRTPQDLGQWIATRSPDELGEPFTYVVDLAGLLLVASRRSEHVACAGGADVLAAGETGVARGPAGGWRVSEVSNLSTGYCPDPDCWPAVADALDRAGIARPSGFTHMFVFRRCPQCGQHSLVKDADFTCAVCCRALPHQWNIDPANARCPARQPR